jgi:hypothetical protein
MGNLEKKYLEKQSNGAKEIYDRNKKLTKKFFNKLESVSGVGSTVKLTEHFRSFLDKAIKNHQIKSISDCPCGDFNWMRYVNLEGIDYTGYDIVSDLLEENINKFPNFKFKHFNAIEDVLPEKDLIVARDFLFHLSKESGEKVIHNFRASKSKFIITTSFDDLVENVDLKPEEKERGWGWRKINIEKAPYNLGEPIDAIEEKTPNGVRYQKLYRLN